MLVNYSPGTHIFIVCGKTDMRRGSDGLAGIITDTCELDIFDNAVFLFCGNRTDCCKALHWGQDGFLLVTKRLQLPRKQEEVKDLSSQELRWFLEALSLQQSKV